MMDTLYYIGRVGDINGRVLTVDAGHTSAYPDGELYYCLGSYGPVNQQSKYLYEDPVEAVAAADALLELLRLRAEKRIQKLRKISRVRIWDTLEGKEVPA